MSVLPSNSSTKSSYDHLESYQVTDEENSGAKETTIPLMREIATSDKLYESECQDILSKYENRKHDK